MYSERRATGELVHVEVGHGVVVAVAGWMLDAAVCSALTLGPPRGSATALAELHRLLVEHGYPYEPGWKSASKIGSSISLSAPCTTRSRMAGIDRTRTLPPSFGISVFLTRSGT